MGTTKELVRLGTIKKVVISVLLATILLASMVVPSKKAEAAPVTPIPYGVAGRVLTPDKTGDTSLWIEIARNGDYSLIVRRDFLSINTSAGTWGIPSWQFTSFGTSTSYANSTVREKINAWFNGTAGGYAEKLSPFAPLRQYTVQNTAFYTLGTCCEQVSLYDGFSMPLPFRSGYGNDVAFALSYTESSYFLSVYHFMRGLSIANQVSPMFAAMNFYMMNIPNTYENFMWLRSPGDIAGTIASLSSAYGTYPGRTFQDYMAFSATRQGLVYPALWVDSSIFATTGTVNVRHVYADTNVTFDSETHVVNAGPYGPYPAKNLAGYTAVLAPGSDPASGFINAGETKNITWLYSRVQQQATINVLHLDLQSFMVLELENHSITAGAYGPYLPKSFTGYGDGTLFPGSADPSGTIAGGETKTIIYGYNKLVNNVVVRHEATNGTLLREDSYQVPVGLYGPYSADTFPGYYPGNWDSSSAPPVGFVTNPSTVIVIRFVYEPIIYRGVG